MEVFDRPTNGSVIADEYVIERPLAEGGMGAVYIALQRSTNRRRALKVMHPQMVRDPKNRERFLAEARVSAGIRSAHIVEVIGAGVDALTGTPWLAMELLDGETLQQRLDRTGPIQARELAEMFAQLGEALGAAHDVGVVHRDLKPENLYLTRDSSARFGWSLKILDFGIAKVVQENRSSATSTSQMGTPLYMAPEQAESAGQVRTATDVWAVGLIAFRSLVGSSYWLAANTESSPITALFKEMLFDPIESASVRAQKYNPNVHISLEFDSWFERCVERDATQRFVHGRVACEVVANVLREASGTAPVALSPPPTRAESSNYIATNNGPQVQSPLSNNVAATNTGAPWVGSANPVDQPKLAGQNPSQQYPVAPKPQQSSSVAVTVIVLLVICLIAALAGGAVLLTRNSQLSARNRMNRLALEGVFGADSGAMVLASADVEILAAQPKDASSLAIADPVDPDDVDLAREMGSSFPIAPPPPPPPLNNPSSESGGPQLEGHTFQRAPRQAQLCAMIGGQSNAWRVDPQYASVAESDQDARRAGCRAALAPVLDMLQAQELFQGIPHAGRHGGHRRGVEQSTRAIEHQGGRFTWCCP